MVEDWSDRGTEQPGILGTHLSFLGLRMFKLDLQAEHSKEKVTGVVAKDIYEHCSQSGSIVLQLTQLPSPTLLLTHPFFQSH